MLEYTPAEMGTGTYALPRFYDVFPICKRVLGLRYGAYCLLIGRPMALAF
jgi:hypothetical protein